MNLRPKDILIIFSKSFKPDSVENSSSNHLLDYSKIEWQPGIANRGLSNGLQEQVRHTPE